MIKDYEIAMGDKVIIFNSYCLLQMPIQDGALKKLTFEVSAFKWPLPAVPHLFGSSSSCITSTNLRFFEAHVSSAAYENIGKMRKISHKQQENQTSRRSVDWWKWCSWMSSWTNVVLPVRVGDWSVNALNFFGNADFCHMQHTCMALDQIFNKLRKKRKDESNS